MGFIAATLNGLVYELAKIAAFANAMQPPASPQATQMGPMPGPQRVPSINEAAVGSANYKMYLPTVVADMQARAATPTIRPGMAVTPKTIPAAAGALPRAVSGTVPKPTSILGAAARATVREPSSFPVSIAKTISAPAARMAAHL
jgi:hypothetical protein